MKGLLVAGLCLGLLTAGAIGAQMHVGLRIKEAPANANEYIISPRDGATVPSRFTVRFGLIGMTVAPAGQLKKDSGHHHLLIDVARLPAAGQPIPMDAHHVHFSRGQTQATLTLAPGVHTLQLELGDEEHVPFSPPLLSRKITVTVAPRLAPSQK